MAAGPQFANSPNMGLLATNNITVSNTNKDGTTGTYVTFFTAGKQGSTITGFYLTCLNANAASSTATIVRVFVTDGTTTRMILEIPFPAGTPTTVLANTEITVANPMPFIPGGWQLKASIDAAQTAAVVIYAIGGDN